MTAAVCHLSVAQAQTAWVKADQQWLRLEQAQQALRKAQVALGWADHGRRPQAMAAVQRALTDVKAAEQAAQCARRQALLASSRAAKAVWGVALGQRRKFRGNDGQVLEFVVDFLRPLGQQGSPDTFVCAGSTEDGRREMVVLGESHQPELPTDNVIYLTGLLRRQP